MLTLAILTPGLALTGTGTVIAVVPIADGAVQVMYRASDGGVEERLLNRADESSLPIFVIKCLHDLQERRSSIAEGGAKLCK
jgi:hypothetical protein